MSIEKEVQFKLTAKLDGKAAKAFQDVGKAAEDAGRKATVAERQIQSAVSGGRHNGAMASVRDRLGARAEGEGLNRLYGGSASEAGRRSDPFAAVRGAARAFIAVRALQMAGQSAAAIATAQTQPGISSYDRDRQTKEAIPVLGGFVKNIFELVDAISGYNAKLFEVTQRIKKDAALQQIQHELNTVNLASELRSSYATNAAENFAVTARFAQQPAWRDKLLNPTTGNRVTDEFLSKNPAAREGLANVYSQQLLAQNAVGTAQRDENTAFVNARLRNGEVKPVPWRFLPKDIPAAEAGFNQEQINGMRAGAVEAYGKRLNDRLKLAHDLEDAERAVGELLEKQKATAIARNELAKADLAVAKAKRDILQDQVQSEKEAIKSGAQAFGLLRPNERAFAVASAKRLRDNGIEGLSDAERAILNQAGVGAAVQKSAEKAGMNDPLFKELLQVSGEDHFAKLRELNIDLDKLKPQIDLKVILDPAQLAKELADIVNKGEKRVREIAVEKAENLRRMQEEKERAARIGLQQ